MIFATIVNGIPCQCHVLAYSKAVPGSFNHPPEGGEFEYELLDRNGRRATWLDRYINPVIDQLLAEEHHIMVQGEEEDRKHNYQEA